MAANVTLKSVAQSEHNNIHLYTYTTTHKLAASFRFWQLNYMNGTQLSTGIRSHFTVDYEDWLCDTDAHTHHCHFPFCVYLFLLRIFARYSMFAHPHLMFPALRIRSINTTACTVRMIRKWNGKHKNKIHFSFHFIFAVMRCVLVYTRYVSNVLAP